MHHRYIRCMRTTLAIEDSVLESAKQAAGARGVTLGELVTDALRVALASRQPASPPPFRVVVYGTPGKLASDPRPIASLLDDDDVRSVPGPFDPGAR